MGRLCSNYAHKRHLNVVYEKWYSMHALTESLMEFRSGFDDIRQSINSIQTSSVPRCLASLTMHHTSEDPPVKLVRWRSLPDDAAEW